MNCSGPTKPPWAASFITYSMLAAIALALVGIWIVLARNKKLPANLNRKKQRIYKPKRKQEMRE
ncbi:MAG: hypothetical protein M5U34_32240 [Chloroflexi bacterium]|nr:hypothetical protein [Chloroflexota bacterium]